MRLLVRSSLIRASAFSFSLEAAGFTGFSIESAIDAVTGEWDTFRTR